MTMPRVLQQCIVHIELTVRLSCSHPEGATDALQSSLSEPMLNNTGNASSTQRLLEGQTDPATTTKALAKPDAWVQAGKTLCQRATGDLSLRLSCHGWLYSPADLDVDSCFASVQAFGQNGMYLSLGG